MPSFTPADLGSAQTYLMLTSVVVPRPIAWVGSRSQSGVDNLAPHSYFNVISADPPIVHVTSVGTKDTLTNVRATGQFTVSIIDRDLLEAMNTTAADFPADIDEFGWAGLAKASSETIEVPWVARAPAALECSLRTVLSMGDGHMMFGDVTRIHVAERAWTGERVDPRGLDPVGRLSGSNYLLAEQVTHLRRPTWADLRPDEAGDPR